MAIVSRLSLSILALAGTLAASGAVFAVENDPFDRYGVAPPTDPAKPANPAEAIMGIGNPHASQPNAESPRPQAGDEGEQKRAQETAEWADVYSRDVYPNMGLGDPHAAEQQGQSPDQVGNPPMERSGQ